MIDTEQLKKKFMDEVAGNPATDPGNDHDWFSLAYGYMLAHGMPPGEETSTFAFAVCSEAADRHGDRIR